MASSSTLAASGLGKRFLALGILGIQGMVDTRPCAVLLLQMPGVPFHPVIGVVDRLFVTSTTTS